ncbi:TPA: DUF1642 domain-containing protein, partial [Streptococcus suis]|nr:DUF1642 domain-containing protein [Streptococcus suis]
ETMNKQEAIEKLTNIANGTGWVTCTSACNIISQIDQPQKVVVPKEVVEWIEECKRSGWHLQKVLSNLDDDEKVGDWAYDENDDLIPEKVDMVARAWLFGYEIEQEQLYTVALPNPNSIIVDFYVLMLNGLNQVVITKEFGNDWKKKKSFQLTEAEIKQDFEWAWQFAKEVE